VDAARAWPTGEIALAACEACGFVGNVAFDEALTEYSSRYEETQGFSPTFQSFHRQLAEDLIARHGLRNKKVVEIGCGKGEFLHLLCALGDNEGIGFDPAYLVAREQPVRAERVRFVADFFSEKYEVAEADFVACKMTLEHIPDTGHFIGQIRQGVKGDQDTVVFVQVPEATRILSSCAFEDIYYEHCSYFTPASLSTLLERQGFRVLSTGLTYGDQYLTVEAGYGSEETDVSHERIAELDRIRDQIQTFPRRVAAKIERWRADIQRRASAGQRVVIWGSGSKGVAFLTTLGMGGAIDYAVDINPHRRGYYMPGGGQRIVSPDDLKEIKPDYVVVMNPVYEGEVRALLDERGLTPDLATL
jgi:SAM-dependent methyltransferase